MENPFEWKQQTDASCVALFDASARNVSCWIAHREGEGRFRSLELHVASRLEGSDCMHSTNQGLCRGSGVERASTQARTRLEDERRHADAQLFEARPFEHERRLFHRPPAARRNSPRPAVTARSIQVLKRCPNQDPPQLCVVIPLCTARSHG